MEKYVVMGDEISNSTSLPCHFLKTYLTQQHSCSSKQFPNGDKLQQLSGGVNIWHPRVEIYFKHTADAIYSYVTSNKIHKADSQLTT